MEHTKGFRYLIWAEFSIQFCPIRRFCSGCGHVVLVIVSHLKIKYSDSFNNIIRNRNFRRSAFLGIHAIYKEFNVKNIDCTEKFFTKAAQIINSAMMRMFKLVIFDLDGTLINSVKAIAKSINLAFAEIGLGPYDWNRDIVRFFGTPFGLWVETLLKEAGKYSDEMKERMKQKTWDNYSVIGPQIAKLNPGALKTLETLKKKGVKMAVATNMLRRHADIFLPHFGILKYFDKVCTFSDVERGKPYPDQLDCILKETGAKKSEILMVGDTRADLEFARNAGVRIAMLDAPWNKLLHPDYRIKRLDEVLEFF